jgi:uncharacterized protein
VEAKIVREVVSDYLRQYPRPQAKGGGLVADLEQLLGRRVDVLTENGLSPLIRDRVLSEAVPL